jgi:uncharacterized phage-like protein YoqJ
MYKVMITGHRNLFKRSYYDELEKQIIKLKHEHKDLVLITGMALGVDQAFCEIGLKYNIPVRAYLPFYSQTQEWVYDQVKKYLDMLLKCECAVVTSSGTVYKNTNDLVNAIVHHKSTIEPQSWSPSNMSAAYRVRNQEMVNDCDEAVIVMKPDNQYSGTAQTLRMLDKALKPYVIIKPK